MGPDSPGIHSEIPKEKSCLSFPKAVFSLGSIAVPRESVSRDKNMVAEAHLGIMKEP